MLEKRVRRMMVSKDNQQGWGWVGPCSTQPHPRARLSCVNQCSLFLHPWLSHYSEGHRRNYGAALYFPQSRQYKTLGASAQNRPNNLHHSINNTRNAPLKASFVYCILACLQCLVLAVVFTGSPSNEKVGTLPPDERSDNL
jgi:hypothetical protein